MPPSIPTELTAAELEDLFEVEHSEGEGLRRRAEDRALYHMRNFLMELEGKYTII